NHQAPVARYLTGRSVAQSRLGLLFNGLVKLPMQFGILFLGVKVFAFYQFAPAALFWDPVETRRVEAGAHGEEWRQLEARHRVALDARRERARAFVAARHGRDPAARAAAGRGLDDAEREVQALRGEAVRLVQATDPGAQTSD